jgi:hypothetical protein
MIPTAPQGFALLALAALVIGFGFAFGQWIAGRLASGITRKPKQPTP